MYPDAQIYCLFCIDDYYYIGSTTTDIKYRLRDHKASSITDCERFVYKHINTIGWENVTIMCIEKFPCNTREELRQKENEYIEDAMFDDKCLNTYKAYCTDEEMKEYQRQYKKEYRQLYPDKIKEYNINYVKQNEKQVKERRKKYNALNKEKIAEKCKEYAEAHKEEIVEYKKNWVVENKEKLKEQSKEYRENNKEKIAEKGKKYYEKNKEVMKEKHKLYAKTNKDKLNEYNRVKRQANKEKDAKVCDTCGGHYVTYHKKRHEESKKHKDSIQTNIPTITTFVS